MGVILLITFLVAFFSFSAQLYVSPSGTGTACTKTNPCSLQTALGMVGNNGEADTIYLAQGEYSLTSNLPLVLIQDNKPLTIEGQVDPYYGTILSGINGGGSYFTFVIQTSGADDNVKILFKNLAVTGSSAEGIKILADRASVEMDFVLLESNRAGGIYINGRTAGSPISGDIRIYRSYITNNSMFSGAPGAATRGGGLYINTSGKVYIEYTYIEENGATDEGGGVYINIEDANIFIYKSRIGYNIASGGTDTRGGGLYITGSYTSPGYTIAIIDTTIRWNKAEYNPAAYIWVSSGNPYFVMRGSSVGRNLSTMVNTGTTFITSAFFIGGEFRDVLIESNIIYGNEKDTGASGVRVSGLEIYADITDRLEVGHNTFENNEYAGIFILPPITGTVSPSSFYIYGNRFKGNRYGANISARSPIVIANNIFQDNIYDGLGLFSADSAILIENIFYNNSSDGLYFYADDTTASLELINNVFWNNTSCDAWIYNQGSGSLSSPVPVTLSHNDFSAGANFSNPTSCPLYIENPSTYTQTNNKAGRDPLFRINSSGEIYGVQDTSPLIDDGTSLDPAYSFFDFDFRGLKKPSGTTARDRGAFEYHSSPSASVSVNPSPADFGDVKVGESNLIFFEITNTGDCPVSFGAGGNIIGFDKDQFRTLPLEYPSSFSIADACTYNLLQPGRSCYLAVEFDPKREGFAYAELVLGMDNFPCARIYPTVVLTGTGIVPDIDMPSSLSFLTPIGDPQIKTVTISNTGSADLVIDSVTLSGSSRFSISSDNCSGQTIPAGSSCTVDIRFAPTETTVQTARLTVFSDDPDENPAHTDLSGVGTIPDIDVNPHSLDFGSASVGATVNGVITVNNEGQAPLIISSVTVNGAGFNLSSHNCGTLTPGGTCDINVTFSPGSAGSFSGTVEIVSNDPDEGTVVVNLSGTGVTYQPDIDPDNTSLDFGTLWTGNSSIKTLIITNVGLADLNINNVSVSGAGFSISSQTCNTATLLANASCIINVSFNPASEGTFNGEISIESNDPDENPLVITLTGTAVLPPDIKSDPEILDFGTVNKGQTVEKQITITNIGSAVLSINTVSLNDTVFKIKSTDCNSKNLAKNQKCYINVTFKSDESGNFTAVITINSNDPDEGTYTILLKGKIKTVGGGGGSGGGAGSGGDEGRGGRRGSCSTGVGFPLITLLLIPLVRRFKRKTLITVGALSLLFFSESSFGGSLYFDGNSYVTVSEAPTLGGNQFTIEAWVYTTTVSSDMYILRKGNNSKNIHLVIRRYGEVEFMYNGYSLIKTSAGAIGSGSWHHIAVTYAKGDYGESTINIFVDGYLKKTYTDLFYLPAIPGDITIGKWNDKGLFGYIAEVRLWNYAKTQDEIRRDIHRRIIARMDGLIGVWHLEENEEEGFGRYNTTFSNSGGSFFSNFDAPIYNSLPVYIPISTITPQIDGSCGQGEYSMWFFIWDEDPYPANGYPLGKMYVTATSDDIYVCIDAYGSTGNYGLYLDVRNKGGNVVDSDNYRIIVDADNSDAYTIQVGNGGNGYTTLTKPTDFNVEALGSPAGEFSFNAEYRIGRDEILSKDGLFRMQFMRHTGGGILPEFYDIYFPYNAHPSIPDRWLIFKVNDGEVLPPDSRAPVVSMLLSPEVKRGNEVAIFVYATDDTDIERIDIYRGGNLLKSCTFPGSRDEAAYCTDTFDTTGWDLGYNYITAYAYDSRGLFGYTSGSILITAGSPDGEPPEIFLLKHSPRYIDGTSLVPSDKTVEFRVGAHDPNLISNIWIEIEFDVEIEGYPKRIPCFSGVSATEIATCRIEHSFAGIGIELPLLARYRAVAEDLSGEVAHTRWRILPLRSEFHILFGPDSDDDFLPDGMEEIIGTDPLNPDTDRDSLLDGTEVFGITPAGYVDVVAELADPLRKDVFLQIDYESGLGFTQDELQYIINLYRQRGIALHIETNERPIPSASVGCYNVDSASPLSAVKAAAQKDERGDYYFAPARHWTHIYMYVKHVPEPSGGNYCGAPCERYIEINLCGAGTERRKYLLVHEMGHAVLMAGHGGPLLDSFPPEQIRHPENPYLVYYGNEWDRINCKPNYRSTMNYRWSGKLFLLPPSPEPGEVCDGLDNDGDLVADEGCAPSFISILDYSDRALPSLNESNLNENKTSDFITALRSIEPHPTISPDSTPVIEYTCVDPDERDGDGNNITYYVITDGIRMIARRSTPGGVWQWRNLPSQSGEGIDWNCNGVIESSVSQDITFVDINGCRNRGMSILRSWNEWSVAPRGFPCNMPSFDQPEEYQSLIRGVLCPARSDVSPIYTSPPPDEVRFLDVEMCDGRDNDGDNLIDEGCTDTDGDGVVDAVDNCPETPDKTIIDRDRDGVGDICQNPKIDSVWVENASQDMFTVAWKGTEKDIMGYKIYRRFKDESVYSFLKAVRKGITEYTDKILPEHRGKDFYIEVRVVNLKGVETDRKNVFVAVGGDEDDSGGGGGGSGDGAGSGGSSGSGKKRGGCSTNIYSIYILSILILLATARRKFK